MSKPKSELRPIEFHQLCAIARTVLQGDPAMNDSDWKDRTKAVLSKQGYGYPEPEMLTRALSSVEHALKRTLGSRPVEVPPQPAESVKPQQDDPPWKRSRLPGQWASIAALVMNLQGFERSKPSSDALPAATAGEALAIDEDVALDTFWRLSMHYGERQRVLRTYAELAIQRPAGWNPETIRANAWNHQLSADRCFVCQNGVRSRAWHHVIQIQHGGSNTARNRVALCAPCHSDIHPWLDPAERVDDTGFVHIGVGLPAASGFRKMRSWVTATAGGRCAFDYLHTWKTGDRILRIHGAWAKPKDYCASCALTRHAAEPDTGDSAEMPAPVLRLAHPETDRADYAKLAANDREDA